MGVAEKFLWSSDKWIEISIQTYDISKSDELA